MTGLDFRQRQTVLCSAQMHQFYCLGLKLQHQRIPFQAQQAGILGQTGPSILQLHRQ